MTTPASGPKMAALPENWQDFVRAYIANGRKNGAKCAAIAGFSAKSENSLRVQAHRLLHDSRIQDAIVEECRRILVTMAPDMINVAEEIALNPQEKAADRMTAVKTVLDRTGLHGMTEHKTTVEYLGDDPEQLKRISALAAALGLPIETLLGRRLALEAPTIDVTPVKTEIDGVEY